MSDQDLRNKALLELLKRNGEFRWNWGVVVGAFLFGLSLFVITGRRPVWWKWGLSVVVLACGGGDWLN